MAFGKKRGRKAGRDDLAYYLPESNVAVVCETMDEEPALTTSSPEGERRYLVIECDAEAMGFKGRASSNDTVWGSLQADVETGAIVSVVTPELLAQGRFLLCPTRLSLEVMSDQPYFSGGRAGATLNLALMDGSGKVVERARTGVSLKDVAEHVRANDSAEPMLVAAFGRSLQTPPPDPSAEAPSEPAPDVPAKDPAEAPAGPTSRVDAWEDLDEGDYDPFGGEDPYAGAWEDPDGAFGDPLADGSTVAMAALPGAFGQPPAGEDPYGDIPGPYADVAPDAYEPVDDDLGNPFGDYEDAPADTPANPGGGSAEGVYELADDGTSVEVPKGEDVAVMLVGDGTYSVSISPGEAEAVLSSVLGGGPGSSTELAIPIDLDRPSAGYVAPLVRYFDRELVGLSENQQAEARLVYWNTLRQLADDAVARAKERRESFIEEGRRDLDVRARERHDKATEEVEAQLEKARKDRAAFVASRTRVAELEWDAEFAKNFDSVVESIRARAEVADADDRLKLDAEAKEVFRMELDAGMTVARQQATDAMVAVWRKSSGRIDRLRLNAIEAVAEKIEEARPYDKLAAEHNLLQGEVVRIKEESQRAIAEERRRSTHAIEDGKSQADGLVASARQAAEAETARYKTMVEERDGQIRRLEERQAALREDSERAARELRENAEAQAATYRDQLDRNSRQLEELREASLRRTLWAVAATIVVCIVLFMAVFAVVGAIS